MLEIPGDLHTAIVTAVVSVTWPAIPSGTSISQTVTVPNAPVGTLVYVAFDPAIPGNAHAVAVVIGG